METRGRTEQTAMLFGPDPVMDLLRQSKYSPVVYWLNCPMSSNHSQPLKPLKLQKESSHCCPPAVPEPNTRTSRTERADPYRVETGSFSMFSGACLHWWSSSQQDMIRIVYFSNVALHLNFSEYPCVINKTEQQHFKEHFGQSNRLWTF